MVCPELLQLPPGQVVANGGALDGSGRVEGISSSASAAIPHDYVTTDADRLTLSWESRRQTTGRRWRTTSKRRNSSLEGGRVIGVRAIDRPVHRKAGACGSSAINYRRRRGPVAGHVRVPHLASTCWKAMNLKSPIGARQISRSAMGERPP